MDKVYVDVLVLALNKIEFDARLTNFLDTFQKFGVRFATITIDTSDYFNSRGISYKVDIPEKKKTSTKTYKFYNFGKKFIDWIIPKNIICSDIYSLPLGTKFKRKHHSKLIYDSREIYSALATLSKNPIKQTIMKYFEKLFVRFVDSIIVTGDLDRHFLAKVFPTKDFAIVYNYPKKVNIKPIDLRKKFDLSADIFLAIYQGMLLDGRGIGIAIQALKYSDDLHLFIAGGGPMEHHFRKLAQTLEVDNRVHFLGPIPYNQLLDYTSACDVGLCLVEPISYSYELALPNKLFEYIQAKIPVVATKLPAIEIIFQRHNIGALVDTKITPGELAEIIYNIAKNKENYQSELNTCANQFVWENQEKTILEILK